MRTKLDYETTSYGTGQNVFQYSVSVQRIDEKEVRLVVLPLTPADGRGVGPGRGSVRRLELVLPCSVTRRVAAMLAVGAAEDGGHFEGLLRVDEARPSLAIHRSA